MGRARTHTATKLLWPLALCLSLVVLVPFQLSAQHSQYYNQYMLNPLVINPAYAGVHGALNLSLNSRFQWVGIEGSPQTHTLAGSSPLLGSALSLGGVFVDDRVGVTSRQSAGALASYRIQTSSKTYLNFGIQGSIVSYSVAYSQLEGFNQNDQSFPAEDVNAVRPNVAAGVFWYGPKFYFGASLPTMLSQFIGDENTGVTVDSRFTSMITGGYIFDIHPDVALKPHFLYSVVQNGSPSLDLNLTALFREVLWFGASWRIQNSLNFLVQILATDQISVGYGYELPISGLPGNFAVHEIGLQFRFGYEKGGVSSPRYY